MTTLGKLVLGAMGRLRPRPATGDSTPLITLPPPSRQGGLGFFDTLAARRSTRAFAPTPLPPQTLSDLLWAANGVNRPGGGRTAPSALDAREIDIYVALPQGAYRYDPDAHVLHLTAGRDLRRITGYQDFVDDAPLDLVYVADHARMRMVPAGQRSAYAHVAAGSPRRAAWPPSSAPGSIATPSPRHWA
jgi:Nitroreductase family